MNSPSEAPNRVTLSRNETESLCTKAARGAGFSWGMAEEAGFATGWLAAHGIDGADALLTMLGRIPTRSLNHGAPDPAPGHWKSANGGPLCPIQLGAALTDHALLSDGPFSQPTQFDPVQVPILLLPFLVRAAQIRQTSLTVDWPGARLHVASDGGFDRHAVTVWTGMQMLAIRVTPASDPRVDTLPFEPARLPPISMATLNGLDAFALKTTVPATQASRTGAGSTTSDND